MEGRFRRIHCTDQGFNDIGACGCVLCYACHAGTAREHLGEVGHCGVVLEERDIGACKART